MPRIPKWLGDTMETVFSRMIIPVEVTGTEYLFPDLKRVIMEGDFTKARYAPGNVIEFRVTDTDFRHYTLSAFDREKGICEMLVYLHGRGVGSNWAATLKVGSRARLMGPGGKIKYKEAATRHFVFGDETSVGLMECITREAMKRGHTCYCLAELDPPHHSWTHRLGFQAVTVEKDYEPAARYAAESIAAMDAAFWQQWKDAAFYITGRAKSIQAVRRVLVQKGITLKNILTEPYWAEGKTGL
ncbi:hypothetical protein A8C56_05290 [Niabella ginsenosidivorans]|uniref:FAD-binding FR-type domain-containing protein n=1 Tax=Niabella ginsenosidivorans TaxID=1176587 RepID=A0A1A9I1B1_9BACT|nr:siderophore-interacting protein [Niabella ginsenosidivorans]ANH80482.1 hypothetical protein A8C56_05290 [Niabella ginsenosidivorans]